MLIFMTQYSFRMKYKFLLLLFSIFIIAFISYYVYPEKTLANDFNTTKIVVEKSKHKMYLYESNKLGKTYSISMGANPTGHKHEQGDEKTPEGKYIIDYKNDKSMAYLSMHISYPNSNDKIYATSHDMKPGGDIMIHGLPNSIKYVGKFHRWYDWTNGCIGITNKEMDELWRSVKVGTEIEIKP